MFLWNVGWNSTGYTASYSRRWYSYPVFAELISSAPKMEATCSFETSVETKRASRRHIPEDVTACRSSLYFILPFWRWKRYFPPKSRLKLNGPHGVIFQKTLLLVGFRWNYFVHPEDRGDIFLRNDGWNSTGYTASNSRRWYSLPYFAERISSTLNFEAIYSSERLLKLNRLHGVMFQKSLLLVDFRWIYFFHPEVGDNTFIRNVGWN
jgi:hypothetical protein